MPLIFDKFWDAIVIGTGMGGGTIGRRLAEAGLHVLFVEFGPMGPATEAQDGYPVGDAYSRLLHGTWPSDVAIETTDKVTVVPIGPGAGGGGASAFYAATLERPEPHDLDDLPTRPHPTGGWPVCHAEYVPYFELAEAIFHVTHKSPSERFHPSDDLKQVSEIAYYEQDLRRFLERSGLTPYPTPTAAKFVPSCQSCFGRKCPHGCKMDGRTAGVDPAISTGNAAVVDWCEAIRFHGRADQIDNLEVRYKGQTFQLKARQFVLAAGALSSPRILQRSVSEYWPNGCANGSGLVGRNLMFHLNEVFALWPRSGRKIPFAGKTFSMRDFYFHGAQRLGLLQSMGIAADYRTILYMLKEGATQRGQAGRLPLAPDLMHLGASLFARILGNAEIYSGIIEDFPELTNTVTLDAKKTDQINIVYNFADELLHRRAYFRKQIRQAFPMGRSLALNSQPQINSAHACGTVRFGDDPAQSVLDRDCRANEIHNLYCVDASFMPTSNGVNPSLTIAANALRVGDRIIARMS